MRRRAAPEPRPNRWPFAFVELPVARPNTPEAEAGLGGPTRWCFRVPRWAVLSEYAHAISAAGQADTPNPAGVDAAYGRLLGFVWADEDYALEASPEDGAAVISELCDQHEWPPSLVYALVNGIIVRSSGEIARSEEVRQKLDFFGANGARHASMNSSSPTATSEPSSPSTT